MKRSLLTHMVLAILVLAVVFILLMALNLQKFEHLIHSRRWRPQKVLVATPKFRLHQHGDYWILYNYIAGQPSYAANETITLTTHGDYTYLDLLGPLLKRWNAPISISIFASGSDFEVAINSIRYLHDCAGATGVMMDLLVSFSFVIHADHLPDYIPRSREEIYATRFNCLDAAPFHGDSPTYRYLHALEYPINLLRNVGREAAQTYYVFPLHIELFPTPNFVHEFMYMIKKHRLKNARRIAYCLPVFELRLGLHMPTSKSELQSMLRVQTLMPFHPFDGGKSEVPNQNEWLLLLHDLGYMNIFSITKRIGQWEPWCVTINSVEPLHDERFSLRCMYDKLIHSELLEALDYDFAVLDGAFLVQYTRVKLFQQYNYDNTKNVEELPVKMRKSNRQQLLKFYADQKPVS